VTLSHSVLVYLVVAPCAAFMSCSLPGNRSVDEAAIRAASREWSDAEGGKDLEKCVSFYAEDGERFATGSPLIVGRVALRKEWAKYLSALEVSTGLHRKSRWPVLATWLMKRACS
jgi:hypothetical protein